MTLVISVASPNGAWQVADRRYGDPAPKSFLATKICRLETTDAQGVIAYSGVGALFHQGKNPFELSRWIQKSLLGRKLNLNQTIASLRESATKRGIASKVSNYTQVFQWVGLLDGIPTIDSLGTGLSLQQVNSRTKVRSMKDFGRIGYDWERSSQKSKGVVISTHGNGSSHLRPNEVNRLVKLTKEARKSHNHARRVDAYLSYLVRTASQREGNVYVSPECIVAYIARDGGGHHQAFDRAGCRCSSEALPSVSRGWPMDAIVKAILPFSLAHLSAVRKSQKEGREIPAQDVEAINKALKAIKNDPDDSFS